MRPESDDDLALRRVELALREDPGYRLDPGFAERVTKRVLGAREEFAWFENVAVPVLFVASLLLVLPFVAQYIRPVLAGVLPAMANALAPWEAVRWDLLLGAGAVLALVALAEKLAAPRLRRLLPG